MVNIASPFLLFFFAFHCCKAALFIGVRRDPEGGGGGGANAPLFLNFIQIVEWLHQIVVLYSLFRVLT